MRLKSIKKLFIILAILGLFILVAGNFIMVKYDYKAYANNNPDSTENDVVDIVGADAKDFINVKYIPNKNYFIQNPLHFKNGSDHVGKGTCTTVATQMLIGYHNYYSDRRIIPDGKNFLATDYGDLYGHPEFYNTLTPVAGQGDSKIGTMDNFYYEIFDLITLFNQQVGKVEGIGQALPIVKKAADKYLEKNAGAIKDNVTISFGLYNKNEATKEINEGRPVILGFDKVLNNVDSYHVVVAYGYATYKGEFGYIVHCGWGDVSNYSWIPERWISYMVKMTVNHVHEFEDTGISMGGTENDTRSNSFTHRVVECKTCKLKTIDKLYKTNTAGTEITQVKYSLPEETHLPSLLYGNYINKIGNSAFVGQNTLKYLYLPMEIKNIGDKAFYRCSNLEYISSLYWVTGIGKSAFADCSKLTNVGTMDNVVTLGESAFENCSKIIPSFFNDSKLTQIGARAFANCGSVSYFRIPAKVTEIGNEALINCVQMKTVAIESDSKLQKIGASAFSGCKLLSDISLPAMVSDIGASAFKNCSALKTVNLGTNNVLQTIYTNTFNGCTSLNSFSLPSSVKNIYEYAFKNCSSLTSFNLNNVETLHTGAFAGCTKIARFEKSPSNSNFTLEGNKAVYKGNTLCLYAPGDTGASYTIKSGTEKIEDSAFQGAKNLTSVVFPSTLKYIGHHAFDECSGLKEITLYELCANICSYAFNNCSLNKVTMYSNGNVQFGEKAFGNFSDSGSVFVPNSALSYYRNAANFDVPDANIKPITFRINFNTNGGTAISAKAVYYGSKVNLPTNTTKTGYGLDGWYRSNTAGNGSGTQFANNTAYWDKRDITLYAKWTAKANGNLKFNSNGGEGVMNDLTVKYDQTMTVPACKFTKAGYDFKGWSTQINGNAAYESGKSYKFRIASVLNLYAVWEAHAFKINYDGNGANINTANLPKTYTVEKPVTLVNANCPGFVFFGWSFDTFHILKTTEDYCQDLDLRAEWTVTYHMGGTTTTNLNDVAMILDFSGFARNTSVNKTFIVSNKAAALTIKDADNLKDIYIIIEKNRPTDMMMVFDNATFIGMYGRNAIYAPGSEINLYCNRKSTVTGGRRIRDNVTEDNEAYEHTSAAIMCGTLYILSFNGGQALTLIGGDGINGSAGAVGKNGGVDEVGSNGSDGSKGVNGGFGAVVGKFYIYSNQPVYIYGGNGGNGGRGGNGGSAGARSGVAETGKIGAAGLYGGNGGNGGNAGAGGTAAFVFGKCVFGTETKVYLKNGNSGNGGNGGTGGKGGRGQKGGPGKFGVHAARGGTGGTGGYGGNGGNAYSAGTCYITTFAFISVTKNYTAIENNYVGTPGQGGAGGAGGAGGEGGKKWPTNNLADSGPTGARGESGAVGTV